MNKSTENCGFVHNDRETCLSLLALQWPNLNKYTAQIINFSLRNFFSKCQQICRNLSLWSDIQKKSLTENFSFCSLMQLTWLNLNIDYLIIFLIECVHFVDSFYFAWIYWEIKGKKVQGKNISVQQIKFLKLHCTFVTSVRVEHSFSVNIYLFKVSNRKTGKRCGLCSELTIKTPEGRHWRRSGVFICWLGTYFTPFSSTSIFDFEQVNVMQVNSLYLI